MESIFIDKQPTSARTWAIDALIALGAFGFASAQLLLASSTIFVRDIAFRTLVSVQNVSPHPTAFALLALTTLPLILRRRFSLATFLFTFTVFLLTQATTPGFAVSMVGPAVALFSVARQRRPIETAFAGAATVIGVFAASVPGQTPVLAFLSEIQNVSYAAIGCALGAAFRLHAGYADEARAHAAEAAQRAEEQAARRIEEERVAIAREVHDITAHSLSAVGIQAAAAQRLIRRNPDLAEEAIAQVREISRTSLAEIRALVAVLRTPGSQAEQAPTSGTERFAELAAYARDAGLELHADLTGYDAALAPAFIDVAVFGILREAMTNAVRHARAERLFALVRLEGDAVRLLVADDGQGSAEGGEAGAREGHGIEGMGERVRALGGEFQAGPIVRAEVLPGFSEELSHGFAVRATIPFTRGDER